MKVRVRNGVDFIKYTEFRVELDPYQPFKLLIPSLTNRIKSKGDDFKYLIISKKDNLQIRDFNKSLMDYKFSEDDSIQIQKTETFTLNSNLFVGVGYIGPIVIFTYHLLSKSNCDTVQIVATILSNIHYIKRTLEAFLLHEIGIERYPLKEFIGYLFYYWFLYGFLVSRSIFTQDYSSYNSITLIILSILFLASEYNNWKSHMILRDLKRCNNGQRGIPQGGMFSYVSSAHYFWELISWVIFSLITKNIYSYLFFIYSLLSMGFLAKMKHNSLKEFFGDKYPRNRKAFIPLIF